jgi:hypothetical protein
MSETTVAPVTDAPVETENDSTSNPAVPVIAGALIGVGIVYAAGFVVKKFRARKEQVHVVTDLDSEKTAS